MAYGDVPVERNPALRTHNVNVRIPSEDLAGYQVLAAAAGLSLNKWVLRACRRKAEFERLVEAQRRAYEHSSVDAIRDRYEESGFDAG